MNALGVDDRAALVWMGRICLMPEHAVLDGVESEIEVGTRVRPRPEIHPVAEPPRAVEVTAECDVG